LIQHHSKNENGMIKFKHAHKQTKKGKERKFTHQLNPRNIQIFYSQKIILNLEADIWQALAISGE
jgi:hypothetical protein